jgi:hypothetical protein
MFVNLQIGHTTRSNDLYEPTAYLDVAMLPGNLEILQFKTAPDLTNRSIMGDCAGNGATMNLAARKLNQTGYIQCHCGLVNTEEKVRRLQNQLQLSDSITIINKEHDNDNESGQNRIKVQSTYSEVALVAIRKLKSKNGDATKLTKKEILAILFFVFHTLEDDKKKKDVLVAVLSHHTRKDQTKLPCLRLVPRLAQATSWEADESPVYLGVHTATIITFKKWVQSQK